MTPLIERMREELVRRNFSPMTIRSYLHAVEVFHHYLGKPLEDAGPDDIRHHQVHLLEDRKLARGTVVIHISALRFPYIRVLKRREMKKDLAYPKCRKRLPVVLSREEAGHLIDSAKNLLHRAMLRTLYGTGVRHIAVMDRRTARVFVAQIDQSPPIRLLLYTVMVLAALLAASPARSQLVPGSMDVHWSDGARDCATNSQPPLQVHPYNPRTFILRENLCATSESPFMYFLLGSTKALLIDTGDLADPNQAPLAKTVMHLLSANGFAKLPLLVVHTHRHLDHRAGDGQFMHLSDVQVVGFDIDSVRRYYNFTDWPKGFAQIDLGDRTVDVIPTPGHSETEVSFYDRNTGLFLSGDFLMPARLLVDDATAYLASAKRVAAFVRDRPVSFVLGGHIEMDTQGKLFPWQSQYHPHEHVLQMTKADLLALPAAISSFNGFYTESGNFILMNSIRILIALAALVGLVLTTLVLILIRYVRRRRRTRRRQAQAG